ncbi:MAG: hypothetical protein KA389_06085 [Hydromonas sp.]|nr:hypothetical protein [Hydromonas sp.]
MVNQQEIKHCNVRCFAHSPDSLLAWEFFIFFARFEYSLKRKSEYLMHKNADAKPNWDKYASDVNGDFISMESKELDDATTYFIETPPCKQITKDGELRWSDPQKWNRKEPKLIWLLGVVRTVRNNLFHGGKYPLVLVREPSRDSELIKHALVILQHALSLNPDIENIFNEDFLNCKKSSRCLHFFH